MPSNITFLFSWHLLNHLTVVCSYSSTNSDPQRTLEIQKRVTLIIHLWLETFPSDFIDDDELYSLIKLFIFNTANSETKDILSYDLSKEDFKTVSSKSKSITNYYPFYRSVLAL